MSMSTTAAAATAPPTIRELVERAGRVLDAAPRLAPMRRPASALGWDAALLSDRLALLSDRLATAEAKLGEAVDLIGRQAVRLADLEARLDGAAEKGD